MNKAILVLLIFLYFGSANSHALEIADVNIPGNIKAGNTGLVLNGAGIRTKFFLKLYVGGLYLKNPNNDPQEIINTDEEMAIKLHIISSMITSEKMENAVNEGFENSTNGNIEPIKEEIENFISVFKQEIKEDDVYDLIYLPDKGVDIYKNGGFFSNIKGLEFKKALFGIWLCNEPAQKSLKKSLLGL